MSARVAMAQCLAYLAQADTVLVYLAREDELPTEECIAALRAAGKKIAVPCIRGNDFVPIAWETGTRLVPGRFGIAEPVSGLSVLRSAIGACLVPGTAFDRAGNRVGRGKGYFDRFLAGYKGRIIGLCFERQLRPSLPPQA